MVLPLQSANIAPIRGALIGQCIGASLTPAMHEAEGHALGLDYQYDIFDTETARFKDMSLGEIIDMAEAKGYAGLNITHPFKVAVIPLLDEISDTARFIGAVNTVVFRDGKRIGDNTDYSGFRAGFWWQMQDAAKDTVVLLGAGGAGASVAFALIDEGVRALYIYDMNTAQSQALAQKVSKASPQSVISAVNDLDVSRIDGIVNATPMGMKDYPGTAIDTALISMDTWVADIVYFPLETALLAQAKARGCRVMNGSGMAIYQAVDAFNLITRQTADEARFAACFARIVTERKKEAEENV